MHQTQDEDYWEVLITQSATTDKHSKVGQRSKSQDVHLCVCVCHHGLQILRSWNLVYRFSAVIGSHNAILRSKSQRSWYLVYPAKAQPLQLQTWWLCVNLIQYNTMISCRSLMVIWQGQEIPQNECNFYMACRAKYQVDQWDHMDSCFILVSMCNI